MVVAAVLAAAALAVLQDPPNRAPAIRAARPPVIDGRDNDAVWRTAPTVTDFHEWDPVEDTAPRFATAAKVAYDERNLGTASGTSPRSWTRSAGPRSTAPAPPCTWCGPRGGTRSTTSRARVRSAETSP